MKLPKRLTYQYGYGSESDITYRRNPDLNSRVRDDYVVLTPEINGTFTYRPTDWLEMTLEMIFEREIPLLEEDKITLPDGEIAFAEDRKFSLLIDQAFVMIKDFTDPLKIALGRRNYEDERHWLYDTSMDIVSLEIKLNKLRAEALVGREVWQDLDLLTTEVTDRIDTYMLYANYRGIEDITLAGYAILRDDRTGKDGQPLLLGVRSQGMRTDSLSYWIEFAYMLGSDESSRDYRGYAFDIGGTYRIFGLPYNPNFTLAYAFASGDDNPNQSKSNEFRQTGLQSNEAQFAGVSEFKIYGEALDPELSNLMIITTGLGFRPAPNVSLDFVYHYYRLDEIAEEIRSEGITALINQVDTRQSKDVGSAFDIVFGYRNLFGIRRLGMDVRAGWFFPGNAFLRDDGDEGSTELRDADTGTSVVAKFWW
ncbi:MAG: alginate export family protein [Nitrospiraceae bacterium]|nr:MAG: alginate export family protein [Nitrospiraceae bacterium]